MTELSPKAKRQYRFDVGTKVRYRKTAVAGADDRFECVVLSRARYSGAAASVVRGDLEKYLSNYHESPHGSMTYVDVRRVWYRDVEITAPYALGPRMVYTRFILPLDTEGWGD